MYQLMAAALHLATRLLTLFAPLVYLAALFFLCTVVIRVLSK